MCPFFVFAADDCHLHISKHGVFFCNVIVQLQTGFLASVNTMLPIFKRFKLFITT